MNIEEFKDIKIAYIRRTGKYGAGNKQLMEKLKNYLKNNDLFKDDITVLGIALDNPMYISEERQRYDVGIIISNKESKNEQRYDVGMIITDKDIHCDLPIRNIDSGRYAIFEVPHTENDVANFWKNIDTLTSDLPVDYTKPIIERYAFSKISLYLCEFCIPLK